MIPPSRAIWVALMLLGAMGAAHAAFNFPQLEKANEEEVAQQLKLDGDRSLREKLKVGQERYQERRAFREGLVSAMRTNTEVRRIAIAGQLAATPVVRAKPSNPSTSLAWVGGVGLVALGVVLKRRFDSLAEAGTLTEYRSNYLLAENPSPATFFKELRAGLDAPAMAGATGPGNGIQPPTQEAESPTATDPLQEFFDSAPDQLAGFRKLFSDISRAADEAARRSTILEFLGQVSRLKDKARPFQLRPVWLMACALEGLFKQLSRNASEVTPSVLRTIAGAVDLLGTMCVRGLNPNLATEPPVRILAVDDHPISRLAISFALKQAFNAPDLAPDGATALDLVAHQTYDVIFLDVEMPGMDGYELCTKIRQTDPHRTTPVVFVTSHGDFDSRAKSSLSGAEALIAKPFLTFEITVKALMLALRGRLQNGAVESRSAGKESVLVPTAPASGAPAATAPPVAVPRGENPAIAEAETKWRQSQRNLTTPSHPDNIEFSALINAAECNSPDAFFARAPAYLYQLRNHLQAARHATEPADQQKFLGRLWATVHSFNSEAERAEMRVLSRLSSALEGMLKKLLVHTTLCTPSTLNAAAAALDLLDELASRTGAIAEPAPSAVRILVVDDDPIARRAISVSVQLVFGRPDHAESGEAALALAVEKPFDLIFLDVLMPGIDGFTACKEIHKTALNRRTPVVFITSRDDMEAQSQAIESGACGLIPKPVLASHITLTALTVILRTRLNQQAQSPALEEAM